MKSLSTFMQRFDTESVLRTKRLIRYEHCAVHANARCAERAL